MACSFARGCWRSPYPTCHYDPTPPWAGRNWYCTRPRADWHSLKTKPVQTGVGGCQLLPAGADGSLNCAAVGGTCCAGGRSPHPTRPLALLSIPGGVGGCRPSSPRTPPPPPLLRSAKWAGERFPKKFRISHFTLAYVHTYKQFPPLASDFIKAVVLSSCFPKKFLPLASDFIIVVRCRLVPVCAPSLTCHVVAIVHSLTPSHTHLLNRRARKLTLSD